LRRVYKDGDNNEVTLTLGLAYQTEMALVQGSHRGHEGQRFACGPRLAGEILHFRDGSD
jgi:hypothetical protein